MLIITFGRNNIEYYYGSLRNNNLSESAKKIQLVTIWAHTQCFRKSKCDRKNVSHLQEEILPHSPPPSPFWVVCFFIIIILQYKVRMKHKREFFPTIGIAMATPQISDKVWSCTDSYISICFCAKSNTACEKHLSLSSYI